MSVDPPPNPLQRKTRLPFEQRPRSSVQQGGIVFYGLLVTGLIGVALYMAFVDRHPLTSGYVAGPAIGALWFGLRLFMMLGGRR
jgi:hypothetical protein